MEVRKVFKAGNSYVVSLPQNMLKLLGLKEGSHLSLDLDQEKKQLILQPIITKSPNLSVEFVRTVNKLLMDHQEVLRRLAQ